MWADGSGGGGGGGSGGEEDSGCLLDAGGICTATLLTCSNSPGPGWAEVKAEAWLAKKASLCGPEGASWESTSGHRGVDSGADVLLLGPNWGWEPALSS